MIFNNSPANMHSILALYGRLTDQSDPLPCCKVSAPLHHQRFHLITGYCQVQSFGWMGMNNLTYSMCMGDALPRIVLRLYTELYGSEYAYREKCWWVRRNIYNTVLSKKPTCQYFFTKATLVPLKKKTTSPGCPHTSAQATLLYENY